MPRRIPNAVSAFLQRRDPRLLLAAMGALSLWAWLMPWLAVLPLLLPAALLVAAALLTLHGARRLLRAYGIFLFFWLGAGFLLGLLDEAWLPLLCRTLELALRLGTMAALALALPLAATPVELGRALVWYLQPFASLVRVFRRTSGASQCWKAGLALAVMLAFIPRAGRIFSMLHDAGRSRLPHIPRYRRLFLAGKRIVARLEEESWIVALAVSARNLYRPEPWSTQYRLFRDKNR